VVAAKREANDAMVRRIIPAIARERGRYRSERVGCVVDLGVSGK
jgi:hypothetical protein